ncbi:winged helix DNA-binding domain-containing protein [Actinomadura hibisca]|uniref:winged helix DNA-binding domain-containing protein n=1 Tax=Actinomadura hibisca TaxID=68565 RepID=UPI000829C8C3|nr:winged helix DNA-binding domain-containing protein [Actinomadura hibisca]
MPSVTWPQVLAWRTRRQHVETPGDAPTADVVRRLAGVQAQVASAAEMAVAVRQEKPQGDVPDALWRDGTLVKTWAVRGTLHLLPADEAGAYMRLCAQARHWEKPSWQKTFGATPADLEAIAAAATAALATGEALTREELTGAIVAETGSTHLAEVLGSGWGTLLKPLAWWGVLRYGPSQGSKVTFTAPDYDVPDVASAARTVIRAYLGAHGPATPEMFDTWLMRKANRKKDVKEWFASLADELTPVSVDGVEMYTLTEHLDELLDTTPTSSVRLLGAFDQYVLGAGTGETNLLPADRRKEVSRTAGWISPVVLHEGRVAGVWEPKDGDVSVTPFEEIPPAPLAAEIDRLRPLLA